MGYLGIHDYGLIGDMHSCALVGLNGSIDWACFPRFDSPSAFAAILDDRKGGRFSIQPTARYSVRQRYLDETNILETTFTTDAGSIEVVDFMTPSRSDVVESQHEICRIVRGISGEVPVRLLFQPRLDYARGVTEMRLEPNGVSARLGEYTMVLASEAPLELESADDGGRQAVAAMTVSAGQTLRFAAWYGIPYPPSVDSLNFDERLRHTQRHWAEIVSRMTYTGLWRTEVVRSFLALHLLMYEPTGAVIAAPTTSLPERIGGERNWDYRYTWLRDAAWTVGVLFRLGDREEGEAFLDWMVDRCWLGAERMQVLYGIVDDSDIQERELEHLEGYKGSKPVRYGNGAAFHRQLDVFGEVIGSLATYHRYHGRLSDQAWDLLRRFADLAAKTWHTPDRSIWEVRGPERHFVYSKVMCWLALDRAALLAETHGYDGRVEQWRAEADKVREEILTKGWSAEKQSFVQHYDSDALDASALIMPFIGFLPPDDPRVKSTIKAVQAELAHGPFVRRYLTEETDDGLEGEEGCFYMLSFWLIGCLLIIGEADEARKMFDQVYGTRNHLGLFAEMIDPTTRTGLGNFPQAFSHIGFIHTARNLSEAILRGRPVEDLIA